MKRFMDYVVVTAAILLLVALVTGVTWCKWAGYKERFPHGGCLGFVTDCKGGR